MNRHLFSVVGLIFVAVLLVAINALAGAAFTAAALLAAAWALSGLGETWRQPL